MSEMEGETPTDPLKEWMGKMDVEAPTDPFEEWMKAETTPGSV